MFSGELTVKVSLQASSILEWLEGMYEVKRRGAVEGE